MSLMACQFTVVLTTGLTLDGSIQLKVLPHCEVPEEHVLLGAVAEAAPDMQRFSGDATPQDHGISTGGPKQATQHAHQSSLASAYSHQLDMDT